MLNNSLCLGVSYAGRQWINVKAMISVETR